MPSPHPHPRPWHRGSVFGDGPRRPLDREQRARFRFLLSAHRRARHLTPNAELVGNALLKRLSVDGRCDPSHDTIADDVGCSPRTTRRALARLREVGLLFWQCRIVRSGDCIDQVANAYSLMPSSAATPLSISKQEKSLKETSRFDGHLVHRLVSSETPLSSLAQIAAARTRALGLGENVVHFSGVSA